jgi:chorismate mutase
MDKLQSARKSIDRLDLLLITVLAERMSLMPEIGEYKHKNKIAIFDEKREVQIMKRLLDIAAEHGLDKGFVEEIFLSIFNESKRIQQETINGMKD